MFTFFLSIRYRWIPRPYIYLDVMHRLRDRGNSKFRWMFFLYKLKCSILWYSKELGPIVNSLCIHVYSNIFSFTSIQIYIYCFLFLFLVKYNVNLFFLNFEFIIILVLLKKIICTIICELFNMYIHVHCFCGCSRVRCFKLSLVHFQIL